MNSKLRNALADYNIRRYFILLFILAAMLIGFSFKSPVFTTISNFTNVTAKFAEIGLLSASMSLVILTGNIDLSVGSVMCFSAFVVGSLMQAGMPIAGAIILTLLIASGIGAINGAFIAYMDMQPVIVTLGTMTAFRGLCYVMKKGGPIRGFPDESFYNFGAGRLFGFIPYSFALLCLVFLGLFVLMKASRFGMDIKAIGNNEVAAAYSGIRVRAYKFLLFTFNGLIAGAAGIIILSRMQGLEASLGDGYEFDAITMCLLGGVSIQGGKGTLLGTFLGIIVIGYLKSGMNLVNISAFYQSAILGVIILLSVVIGSIEKR
ncbi:MAG TPA: ABC transporter permease [Candidatus Pullichristensenella excrementigallinarum]|uniref:ABC transporter permease n=1 Tax=Candidatus Pullichristensenella excrementigallinarum TaxID=2840907 RepID=A0A9D1LCD8_9FIRM|nr:ABC transporter permease [Candidatus Pullichristensenella excrementigallinarum]